MKRYEGIMKNMKKYVGNKKKYEEIMKKYERVTLSIICIGRGTWKNRAPPARWGGGWREKRHETCQHVNRSLSGKNNLT